MRLVMALMFVGCVIPPSLSVDTADAGANAAPAIVRVVADGVELPEYSRVNFEQGDMNGTLNLVVHDTDLDDILTCKVFVDYSQQDPTPPRAEAQTAGGAVQRSCTLPTIGFCQDADIGVERLMQIYVFDRTVLTTGDAPLYQAMAPGGLSTNRTFFLRCQERSL